MLKDAYEKAKELLQAHRNTLDQIADFLITRETITGKEFMDIFHRVENPEETKEVEATEESEAFEEMKVSEEVGAAEAISESEQNNE